MRLLRSAVGASAAGAACVAAWIIAPEPSPSSSSFPSAACAAAAAPSAAERVVPVRPPQAAAVSLSELHRWLERRGADLKAVDIKLTPPAITIEKDSTAVLTDVGRFGVFANTETCRRTTRGLWGRLKSLLGFGRGDVALAKFPVSAALTAASIVATQAQQGPLLQELLEIGTIDERTAVILHLLVERLRGAGSPLRPWLSLLPESFSTPIFWSNDELQWLRGTSLHKATLMKKRMLEELWRRLEPACHQMALKEGVDTPPSFSDFLWAYSIFWSRAVALPSPTAASSPSIEVQEGVVPGLDFANHAAAPTCRWTVAPSSINSRLPQSKERGGTVATTEVRLVAPRGSRLLPGTELTIDYGGKPNEELLYLYGFTLEKNPNDALMVACPLPPPDQWDGVLRSRVALLQLRGLSPQIFLSKDHLSATHSHRHGHRISRLKGAASSASATAVADLDLPPGVMETLEVFVMEAKDVLAELEAAEVASGDGSGSSGAAASRAPSAPGAHSMSDVERSGLRMALLTTLVRLLELKTAVLESAEEGTGRLEVDEALLVGEGGGPALSGRQRDAVVYRAGQKRLAREYLTYGSGLLQQEMRHLRALADAGLV